MKSFKLALLAILLLLTQACSENQKEERKKQGEPMTTPSVLTDKPSFNLRVVCKRTGFRVYLNGVTIYHHKKVQDVSFDYPVNDFITTGKNRLEILLYGGEGKEPTYDPASSCKVTLFVRKFDDYDAKEQDIVTIAYDQSKKKKLEGTTFKGKYDSHHDFRYDMHNGDVEVGKATFEIFKARPILLTYNHVVSSIDFSLQTPFPRWKFLDAPANILDKPYYDLPEKEFDAITKDHPKLNALYALNEILYNAAKNEDIETIVSYFKERNEEEDIAFYETKGATEAKLRKKLRETMDNPNLALMGSKEEVKVNHTMIRDNAYWKNHEAVFYVERGNALAYLKYTLCWNVINDNGSSRSKMLFRYDGHKWIVTR